MPVKVKWNGNLLDRLYITHEDLEKGGLLEFFMGSEPLDDDEQSSLKAFESSIKDYSILPSPAFSNGGRAFQDRTRVAINSATDAEIYFRIIGEFIID